MSQAVAHPSLDSVSNTHSVKRNVLASWFAHAATLVIGFFLMPYVLGVMGDHQYGTWVFVNSFVVYANLLYLGFGETVSRYVAKYQAENRPERVNEVVNVVLGVYLCTGLIALACAGALFWIIPLFHRWRGEELLQVRWVFLILGVNLAVSLCGSVFGGILIGLRRFDLERGVGFVSDLVRCALVVVFLSSRWGLVTIALIYLFITIFEQVLFVWLAFRIYPELRIGRSHFQWSVFKECSAFSLLALVNHTANSLINATDNIVIGFMLGADAIVPYYISLRLTQFIRQPIEKIAHICMPTAGALAVETDPRRLLNFLSTALGVVLLLIGGMFIGGWFFGGDLVRAWMGRSYTDSHRILCILLAAQLVALPCGIFRAFLFGAGHVRVPGIIYMVEAVLNLGLSVLFCHWWGIIGVAWGTMIPAVIVELGLLAPYALKTLDMSWQECWRKAVLPQLPPLAALAAYSWIVSQQPWSHDGWPVLIGITVAGGAVLGLAWLLVQRQSQRGTGLLAEAKSSADAV